MSLAGSLGLPGWLAEPIWQRQWKKAAAEAQGTAMQGYYAMPQLTPDTPLDDVPIVALDFESDGLAEDAALLEAGWVTLSSGGISLSGARKRRIHVTKGLEAKAVTIHQITDSAAAEGAPEVEVLAELLEALSGAVVLAHFAQIEAKFLNTTCQRQFGVPFLGRFICTRHLEEHWFPKVRAADGLRLGKLRAQYGLPWYHAHDGLTDAIACAELFLAQLARKDAPSLTLGDVLCPL
ncbi:MAG: exonuclease domain-containing protein [Pseudomonadota bacterium]